jgi:hypothetical protein
MSKSTIITKPCKHMCRYEFNDPELLAIGKELAEYNEQLDAIEQDKKRVVSDFAAKIASHESDISLAVNKIRSGYEYRDLPCTVRFHQPKTGKKEIVRDDTGLVVAVQDMTEFDLQALLPLEGADVPS